MDTFDLHDMVEALTAALDAKNSYTCGHSGRVAELSLRITRQLKLPLAEQDRIHVGAHLHDIGKIGIPDAILDKPGRLNSQEMEMIKTHPVIGDQIIGKTRLFQSVADIVRHHHERYDGKGYPDGLRGDEIPLGARVVAVADAFDAMTSPRPYRPAMDATAALNELVRCRNSQFDPMLVDVFVRLVADGTHWESICKISDIKSCCSRVKLAEKGLLVK